ncbi:hypothetical protein G6X36_00310 [Staphylococcus aureus]|nr:hypothetical protein [Staphylococcus aureus]
MGLQQDTPRTTPFYSSAASDVYQGQVKKLPLGDKQLPTWQLYLRLPMQFVLMGLIKKL